MSWCPKTLIALSMAWETEILANVRRLLPLHLLFRPYLVDSCSFSNPMLADCWRDNTRSWFRKTFGRFAPRELEHGPIFGPKRVMVVWGTGKHRCRKLRDSVEFGQQLGREISRNGGCKSLVLKSSGERASWLQIRLYFVRPRYPPSKMTKRSQQNSFKRLIEYVTSISSAVAECWHKSTLTK